MIPHNDAASPVPNHDGSTSPNAQEADHGLELITTLAVLPKDAIISEQQFARLFRRHITSVKRAIQRGELPPSVPLLNEQVWTAGVILAHLNDRLEAERKKAGESLRRVQQLRPGQGGRN
jgi:hypothetical protein